MVAASPVEREVWRLLADVPDPEIPILNVIELGVVRYVRDEQERGIAVGVSPTYTGCPATEVIQASIKERLQQAGFASVRVDSVLAPPWTSDWLTAERARKAARIWHCAAGGISRQSAPLVERTDRAIARVARRSRRERVSEFASTPCKAMYRCTSCLEPFEYFKCI